MLMVDLPRRRMLGAPVAASAQVDSDSKFPVFTQFLARSQWSRDDVRASGRGDLWADHQVKYRDCEICFHLRLDHILMSQGVWGTLRRLAWGAIVQTQRVPQTGKCVIVEVICTQIFVRVNKTTRATRECGLVSEWYFQSMIFIFHSLRWCWL